VQWTVHGQQGAGDGSLDTGSFFNPRALCQGDGTLFVADNEAIRAVDGLFASDWTFVKGIDELTDFEIALTIELVAIIPALPKELARVMTRYTRPSGVRTM
jgi:hypothetical protein